MFDKQSKSLLPLVPEALLSRSERVLFMTHLAIGDFTYLQNYFAAFAKKYRNLKIDLMIDRISPESGFALLQWVKATGLFDNVYLQSDSDELSCAKKMEYSVVVPLCSLRQNYYDKLAKKISPEGFIANFDASELVPARPYHITDAYDLWFTKLFGVGVEKSCRVPYVSIPKEWVSYGKLMFTKWGIEEKKNRFEKVVFVNAFAKTAKRCWPIDRVVKLIQQLREVEEFQDAYFIVNTEPQFYEPVRSLFSNFCLQRVFLFTAHENFFQIPSIISLCDLVISVETSIMHLASALNCPVVALMRQKNPEWMPFREEGRRVLFAKKKSFWVEDISLEEVVEAVKEDL